MTWEDAEQICEDRFQASLWNIESHDEFVAIYQWLDPFMSQSAVTFISFEDTEV